MKIHKEGEKAVQDELVSVYSVFDSVAGVFYPGFTAKSDIEAKNAYDLTVNSLDWMRCRKSNFQLFKIAEFIKAEGVYKTRKFVEIK